MTRITGQEPNHWHDADGHHRMPDPRILAAPQPIVDPSTGQPTGEMSAGQSKGAVCHGDPDMAAYWSHLDAHDQLQTTPDPLPTDSLTIRNLFKAVAAKESEVKVIRMLIVALRQRDTQA